MGHLEALWLEMLFYEELPEEPGRVRILVSRDPQTARLLELAVRATEEARPGWRLTVQREYSGEEPAWEVPESVSRRLYGLSETETQGFSSREEYRSFLEDGTRLCAGDFLCQVFRALGSGTAASQMTWEPSVGAEDGSYMVWRTVHGDGSFFYFDNTYGGRLKQLQQIELDCLNEFDRICRKHHISYFLGGGTLLGAVRHEGMIPWDDDVDVMMTRGEYERFVAVVREEIDGRFFYQSSRTDPWYHSIFDKIRRNDTVFMTEYSSRFPQMHQGIFLDIFVHDRTAGSRLGQKLHVFFTLWARSLVFHKWEGTQMQFYGKWGWLCCGMTWFKDHCSMERLERLQHRVVTWYRRRKTGWLYDGTGEHLRHGAFPEAWLETGRTGKLGDRTYPIPREAEKYLAYSYGADYMRMPAPQKRKAAHPIVRLQFSEEEADRPKGYCVR